MDPILKSLIGKAARGTGRVARNVAVNTGREFRNNLIGPRGYWKPSSIARRFVMNSLGDKFFDPGSHYDKAGNKFGSLEDKERYDRNKDKISRAHSQPGISESGVKSITDALIYSTTQILSGLDHVRTNMQSGFESISEEFARGAERQSERLERIGAVLQNLNFQPQSGGGTVKTEKPSIIPATASGGLAGLAGGALAGAGMDWFLNHNKDQQQKPEVQASTPKNPTEQNLRGDEASKQPINEQHIKAREITFSSDKLIFAVDQIKGLEDFLGGTGNRGGYGAGGRYGSGIAGYDSRGNPVDSSGRSYQGPFGKSGGFGHRSSTDSGRNTDTTTRQPSVYGPAAPAGTSPGITDTGRNPGITSGGPSGIPGTVWPSGSGLTSSPVPSQMFGANGPTGVPGVSFPSSSAKPGGNYVVAPGWDSIPAARNMLPGGGPLRSPGSDSIPGATPDTRMGRGSIAPTDQFTPGLQNFNRFQPGPAGAAPEKQSDSGTSSQTLAQQRARFGEEFKNDPSQKERLATLMLSESGVEKGWASTAEGAMNRATAHNNSVSSLIAPESHYYQPYTDGAFQRNLARIRSNPELRDKLYGIIDKAVNEGTNVSNYGTHEGSAGVAAGARQTQTVTAEYGDQLYSRKDRSEFASTHGPKYTKEEADWYKSTKAADEAAAQQGASGKGKLLFIHGMNYERFGDAKKIEADIEAQAQRIAKAKGYAGVDFVRGSDNDAKLAEARDKLKAGGYGGVTGFSQGGYEVKNHLQSEFPNIPMDALGATKGGEDSRFPGVDHMGLPKALADQAEAEQQAKAQQQPGQPGQSVNQIANVKPDQNAAGIDPSMLSNKPSVMPNLSGPLSHDIHPISKPIPGSQYATGTERLYYKEGNNQGGGLVKGKLPGVDEKLQNVLQQATKDLPAGYHVEIISGNDSRKGTKNHDHPGGTSIAIDVKIYDQNGKLIPHDRSDHPGVKYYEQLAQSVNERGKALYPNEKWLWGGLWEGIAAGAKGDPMHIQRFVQGVGSQGMMYDFNKGALTKNRAAVPYLMSDEERANYQKFVRGNIESEKQPTVPMNVLKTKQVTDEDANANFDKSGGGQPDVKGDVDVGTVGPASDDAVNALKGGKSSDDVNNLSPDSTNAPPPSAPENQTPDDSKTSESSSMATEPPESKNDTQAKPDMPSTVHGDDAQQKNVPGLGRTPVAGSADESNSGSGGK